MIGSAIGFTIAYPIGYPIRLWIPPVPIPKYLATRSFRLTVIYGRTALTPSLWLLFPGPPTARELPNHRTRARAQPNHPQACGKPEEHTP